MPSLPNLATVPVWPIVLLLILVSALGVFLALVRLRQPLWAIPAILAGVLGVAMHFSGPVIQPAPKGAPLQNYGGSANFKDRYDANRGQYGEPLGYCHQRRDLLTCPTTYAHMELHEGQPNPYYQIQNANLGDQLREQRGIPRDQSPILAPIILAYFAELQQRQIDRLYWVGYPITNPRMVGDRTEQYFDKIILSWPTGMEDPSQVRREPVGSQMWTIEHDGTDPGTPDPWTLARRLELLGAALLLLISALPLMALGLAGRGRYAGSFDI